MFLRMEVNTLLTLQQLLYPQIIMQQQKQYIVIG